MWLQHYFWPCHLAASTLIFEIGALYTWRLMNSDLQVLRKPCYSLQSPQTNSLHPRREQGAGIPLVWEFSRFWCLSNCHLGLLKSNTHPSLSCMQGTKKIAELRAFPRGTQVLWDLHSPPFSVSCGPFPGLLSYLQGLPGVTSQSPEPGLRKSHPTNLPIPQGASLF